MLNYLDDNQTPEADFTESIQLWSTSKSANPKKLMRLHYFLGEFYRSKNEFEEAYKNYALCYEIGSSIDFDSADLFESVSIQLGIIDLYVYKNEVRAKIWAKKYIDFKIESVNEQFDLNFAKAYSISGEPDTAVEVLLNYLRIYNTKSMDNVDLLFSLYENLTYYFDEVENLEAIVKYGEQALKLKDGISYDSKTSAKALYSTLIYAYSEIGDNINANKYRKLESEEFPDGEDEIDYYNNLKLLLIVQDYLKFESLFEEYENTLINAKDFNSLFKIYALSLPLFENGILFSKTDIEKQKSVIEENINSLSDENIVYFDAYLAEYSFFVQDYVRALQIADNYLDFKEDVVRLTMHRIKAVSEITLGIENGKTTAHNALAIAENLYGVNSPQTLPYLNLVLSLNMMGDNNQATKIGTKALEIIYNNSLENTNIAAEVWSDLGLSARQKGNLKDGELYYKNSINVYENYQKISNPYAYYSSLLGLSSVYNGTGNFDDSLKYLNKTKTYLDGNSNIMGLAYGDYYYYLGHYYFWQDKFQEARDSYEKALNIYGVEMSKGRDFQLILSDYFLNNDTDATIKKLEKYYDDNGDIGNVQKILYLIKFNTNQTDEAK